MAAPSAAQKKASKRRERTASSPITLESHARRMSASQSIAAPRVKVARRQCSVAEKTADAAKPAQKTTIIACCAHRGSGEGRFAMSWGLSSDSPTERPGPGVLGNPRLALGALHDVAH